MALRISLRVAHIRYSRNCRAALMQRKSSQADHFSLRIRSHAMHARVYTCWAKIGLSAVTRVVDLSRAANR